MRVAEYLGYIGRLKGIGRPAPGASRTCSSGSSCRTSSVPAARNSAGACSRRCSSSRRHPRAGTDHPRRAVLRARSRQLQAPQPLHPRAPRQGPHDPSGPTCHQAERMCDRIVMMNRGRRSSTTGSTTSPLRSTRRSLGRTDRGSRVVASRRRTRRRVSRAFPDPGERDGRARTRAAIDRVMTDCLAAGPVRVIERSRVTLDEVFVSSSPARMPRPPPTTRPGRCVTERRGSIAWRSSSSRQVVPARRVVLPVSCSASWRCFRCSSCRSCSAAGDLAVVDSTGRFAAAFGPCSMIVRRGTLGRLSIACRTSGSRSTRHSSMRPAIGGAIAAPEVSTEEFDKGGPGAALNGRPATVGGSAWSRSRTTRSPHRPSRRGRGPADRSLRADRTRPSQRLGTPGTRERRGGSRFHGDRRTTSGSRRCWTDPRWNDSTRGEGVGRRGQPPRDGPVQVHDAPVDRHADHRRYLLTSTIEEKSNKVMEVVLSARRPLNCSGARSSAWPSCPWSSS